MGINLSKVSFAYFMPKGKKKVINYTLKDINLNITAQEEFMAIVGHTGSGKSTLVQLMNSLLLPSRGEVNIFNHIVTNKPKFKLKKVRSHVGLVFQFPEYQIFEDTVLKDIMFGPKNFGIKDPEAVARDVAKIMGIEDLLTKSPFKLSGGQMRKVAIAGILASNPDILILDEPTAGLDPTAKEELLVFLKHMNETFHKSIIIITHDMEVVAKFIKRVVVMNKGKIMYDGSKEDLFKNDEVVFENNLDYPEILRIMKAIKEKLNIDIDIYQYNIHDAFLELKRKLGENNEW